MIRELVRCARTQISSTLENQFAGKKFKENGKLEIKLVFPCGRHIRRGIQFGQWQLQHEAVCTTNDMRGSFGELLVSPKEPGQLPIAFADKFKAKIRNHNTYFAGRSGASEERKFDFLLRTHFGSRASFRWTKLYYSINEFDFIPFFRFTSTFALL